MPDSLSILSKLNNTKTPLDNGETWTGSAEGDGTSGYPDVGVSCFSDTSGVLYFDFRNPESSVGSATDWRTFPPSGFSIAANVHEFHTAVRLSRDVRVRFTNNSGSNQNTLEIFTYFGEYRQPNAPVNFTIADDADAIIVKSVLSGIGNTTATVTDHKALQVTPPQEGKSAFGEARVSELTPILQLQFPYNVNSRLVTSRANQSGTVTVENNMLKLSTGAAANSSAHLYSKDTAKYRPGQGVTARFTGVFTTGVANSTQGIGVGNVGDGFFFGYNGTSFGILHRKGGSPEIRTLTITTKSSTAENITITLDGDSTGDTVAVTNGADTTVTANEIAAHDYSDIGRGWTAYAVGSTVVFESWSSEAQTGTYSLSSATTAVGSFAQTLAGAAANDDWIPQTSWNGDDIFDGAGLTGVTINPAKGNVYQISYQWLGFGAIYFYVEDPDDGELHNVHTIAYANANTTPSVNNPTFELFAFSENTSNTSDVIVRSASMAAMAEGKEELVGSAFGLKASKTLGATSAETPITSFMIKQVFQNKKNRTKVKINLMAASVEHTKPVSINLYTGATLVGASFADVASNVSALQQDTSATSFSGGTLLFSLPLGKSSNQIVNFLAEKKIIILEPGEILTATIAPSSGNAAEANISLHVTELF